jgi:hypothetical protein
MQVLLQTACVGCQHCRCQAALPMLGSLRQKLPAVAAMYPLVGFAALVLKRIVQLQL